jgi:hypothetical protein
LKTIVYTLLIVWFLGVISISRIGDILLRYPLEKIYNTKIACVYRGRNIDYCYAADKDIPLLGVLPDILFWIFIGVPFVLVIAIIVIGEYKFKKGKK